MTPSIAALSPVVASPAPARGGLRARYFAEDVATPRQSDADTPYQQALIREAAVPLRLDTIVKSAVPGPDIQWHPSYETYLRRVAALKACRLDRETTLPEGYPQRVAKPWVWSGDEITAERYVVRLSEDDIEHIEGALSSFKGKTCKAVGMEDSSPGIDLAKRLSLGPESVSQETFPLPKLRAKLGAIANDLHNGIGFTVLRGLDPAKYTALDNVLLYLGVTSYIAEKRGCQDSSGNMISEIAVEHPMPPSANWFIVHIKDIGYSIPNSQLRQSPYANNAQVRRVI
jgi:hypothetical protein